MKEIYRKDKKYKKLLLFHNIYILLWLYIINIIIRETYRPTFRK